jgi:phage antirepressor YoqD-like protein
MVPFCVWSTFEYPLVRRANFTPHFPKIYFSDKYTVVSGTIHNRTMKLLQCVWAVFEKLLAFLEDPKLINKRFMYFLFVKYVEKYRFQEKIVKNKSLLLFYWENVSMVRGSVSACLKNFVAITWRVPEKKLLEYDRFTIAEIQITTSP